MEIFSTRLKAVLEKRGFSQRKFASVLDVDQTAVCKLCNGQRLPSVTMLLRICEFLDVSADYLLGLTDEF